MQWQAPSGGLFTVDMQSYFWQAVYWLMVQAAPLLMVVIAATLVAYVYRFLREAITAPYERDPYTESEDSEEEDVE
ncbi:MAG: hypothetical protein K6T57_15660 [Thermaceae bacterium]|nr:hypothetical protein [Thermaceae bacterium]